MSWEKINFMSCICKLKLCNMINNAADIFSPSLFLYKQISSFEHEGNKKFDKIKFCFFVASVLKIGNLLRLSSKYIYLHIFEHCNQPVFTWCSRSILKSQKSINFVSNLKKNIFISHLYHT